MQTSLVINVLVMASRVVNVAELDMVRKAEDTSNVDSMSHKFNGNSVSNAHINKNTLRE